MGGNRVCKICNRSFSNGKAIGGHMRSHFAKLPPRLPAQLHQEKPQTLVPPAAHVPCSAQNHVLTVHDRGSDTESSRRRKRNRSQRRRRHGSAARVDAFSNADAEQTISSVSETETLSEAGGALCLMMLSRDNWSKRARAEADEHEDDSVSVSQTNSRAWSCRPRYQCETCNKGFGSYQALGGHRASHKKISGEILVGHNHKRLAFECPHCHKVFDSGQALGGHKKVHKEAIPVTAKSTNCGESLIDLNLPAPEENGEETTASLVEISSVSNEETSYPIKKGFLQV
ncbi:zinc finger protein ZAT1-like [Rhodamnia argentea]|uniref:Zinc finger protein ZAT1-like n=1 Tax=Rhodamnia argentea TaxID=178133 RepID=A0A8B8PN87_9MYRT|nr:zinc finger protein ZAT1-like [Rhodamnia argentea]XP_030536245.2 zinc finger protein ZAT1-like [Rhodamnia argentea]